MWTRVGEIPNTHVKAGHSDVSVSPLVGEAERGGHFPLTSYPHMTTHMHIHEHINNLKINLYFVFPAALLSSSEFYLMEKKFSVVGQRKKWG